MMRNVLLIALFSIGAQAQAPEEVGAPESTNKGAWESQPVVHTNRDTSTNDWTAGYINTHSEQCKELVLLKKEAEGALRQDPRNQLLRYTELKLDLYSSKCRSIDQVHKVHASLQSDSKEKEKYRQSFKEWIALEYREIAEDILQSAMLYEGEENTSGSLYKRITSTFDNLYYNGCNSDTSCESKYLNEWKREYKKL